MSTHPLRIGIVAGEASGDMLASGMIRCIKQQHPDAIIEGICGPLMISEGGQSLFDMEELSVMGLVEVLSRIRRLLFIRKTVLQHFLQNPPDVFIGVDAPDFNLKLETLLKAEGIKTVHYVSPTVWAWRENRIFGIGKATNLVLSILPFEKQVYDKYGFPCRFVGHTMADSTPLEPDQQTARDELNISQDQKVLALLPGSRGGEVNMLLDIFLQSANRVNQQCMAKGEKPITVLIPAANEHRKQQIESVIANQMDNQFDIQVFLGKSRQVMVAADAILLASGTATLEAMLCKRPMVVAYKLKWLTHQMMKWLYKAKYFALPNLLADEKIVPELLQEDVNPVTISNYLTPLIMAEKTQDIARFTQLHKQLKQGADQQSAKAVLDLINEKK